jgi:hypothetical protein
MPALLFIIFVVAGFMAFGLWGGLFAILAVLFLAGR